MNLLQLPAELRQMIWDRVVDRIVVHHTFTGNTICAKQNTEPCSMPEQCHQHRSTPNTTCIQCVKAYFPGWALTCRQMRAEVGQLYARKVGHAFSSGEALTESLRRTARIEQSMGSFRERLHRVHLDLGPGKYATVEQRRSCLDAVTSLSRAPRLKVLHLTCAYYHRASADDVVLGTKTLRSLLRLHGLDLLTLRMLSPLPGPIGHITSEDLNLLRRRVLLLQLVLQRYLCARRSEPADPAAYNQLLSLETGSASVASVKNIRRGMHKLLCSDQVGCQVPLANRAE